VISDRRSSQAKLNYQVLVVDDSKMMQQAVAIELNKILDDINIDFADSGERALERINQKQYDVIFLDIMMSGIDGYETCKIIRKKENMKKTPIMMLTGKRSALDELKGGLAGCTTYLTKPIHSRIFQVLQLPHLLPLSRKWSERQKLKASEIVKKSFIETKTESIVTAKQEPTVDRTDSVIKTEQEPTAEANTESIIKTRQEPTVETQTESIVNTKQEPTVETKTESIVEAKEEPVVKAKVVVAAADRPRYKVLVVDDSKIMQKALEVEILRIEDIIMDIGFADSGEEALTCVDNQQYDLVFLDVMMPGIDGFETCTQMRKKPTTETTPIIIVTGKTNPLDEVKGIMAGCTTYLTKPLNPEKFQEMMETVSRWLEKQTKKTDDIWEMESLF